MRMTAMSRYYNYHHNCINVLYILRTVKLFKINNLMICLALK